MTSQGWPVAASGEPQADFGRELVGPEPKLWVLAFKGSQGCRDVRLRFHEVSLGHID
jgi:hypothetical protein